MKHAGLATALLISLPSGAQAGKHKQAFLCNIDLMPTLLDLAGIDLPNSIDGKSFAQDILSDKDTGRDGFFTEMTWHDAYEPMRGMRTPDFSYVKNFNPDGPKVYMTVDSHLSLSGQVMREECYVPNEPEELYDLAHDPLEEHNVIDSPEFATVAATMRQRVEQWMKETNDPLLQGPIPGHPSHRWAAEIAAGRAYPGRAKYYELHPELRPDENKK
jgi:arylsulfatase A-like enzyme